MNEYMFSRQQVANGVLALCLAFVWSTAVRAETLRVGSTGSAAPLIRLLFEEFRKQAPDAELDLATPPLGSGGALRALVGGQIAFAIIGRPLTPEEKSHIGLQFDLAATPFVMASSAGVRRHGFRLDELAAVYKGSLRYWDDGKPIRLVLRASFESDTLQLRSMSPQLDAAMDIAAQRPGMAIGKDDLDTLALLTKTSGSFGPTTLGLLTAAGVRLSLFPLDGIEPSVAAMRSGRYPWRKTLSVVLPQSASPLALRFADFLRGRQTAALMSRYDYLPLVP